jgi:hypothetical protein
MVMACFLPEQVSLQTIFQKVLHPMLAVVLG